MTKKITTLRAPQEWPRPIRLWENSKTLIRLLLLLGLIGISFTSILFEQISINQMYEGISIPDGESEINIDFENPTEMYLTLPYTIENKGYHTLKDITLKITLRLHFTDKEDLSYAKKAEVEIFSEKQLLGYVEPDNTLKGIFESDYRDFDLGEIGDYVKNRDEDKADSEKLLMDVELTMYLEGIEQIWIIIEDIDLTEAQV